MENNVRRKKQNQEQENQSTQIIATVLAIAILIVAVVGISFAAFTYTQKGEKENSITTGSITMNYVEGEKSINITDAFPISDAVGKAMTATSLGSDANAGKINSGAAGVFDFNVSATITGNVSINYDVMATKKEESTLEEDAVKMYLEKSSSSSYSSTEPVLEPTLFSELDEASLASTNAAQELDENSKVLISDTFSSSVTDYYRLKMWVTEEYGSEDQTGDTFKTAKTFKVTVDVYGQAGAGS